MIVIILHWIFDVLKNLQFMSLMTGFLVLFAFIGLVIHVTSDYKTMKPDEKQLMFDIGKIVVTVLLICMFLVIVAPSDRTIRVFKEAYPIQNITKEIP